MKLNNDLVVLDLETTGVWIEKDKIIEIAMIKIHPDDSQVTFHKKINPTIPIPPEVSAMIGISNEDVKTAPKFDDIAAEVVSFLSGCDLAGFNISRFDLPLLCREIQEAGQKFDYRKVQIYDVQKVFHLNEKRDLTAAYQFYCSKILENAHSALADTQATVEILKEQVARYGEGNDALRSLGRFQYEQMVEFLDDERKFRWWNGKVYMMFGKYAKRHSLDEVARNDPGYLEWILSAKFSEQVKTLVANALQGRFPVFEYKNRNADDKSE